MRHCRQIVGIAFILALFTLMTGQAKAGSLDFTQGLLDSSSGVANVNLDYAEPALVIMANYGFRDNDPLFLTYGRTINNCEYGTCGLVYSGSLGTGNGLGVRDISGTGLPTIDNHEALIFYWGGTSVFASDMSLSFYGLMPSSEQVHIALLFAGSDGSNGYDFNDGVTLSATSTFHLNTLQEAAGHNLAWLVVYANADSGNVPFGVTALDSAAPEPGSALLLTTGLAVGLLWARKRRHARG